MEYRYLGLSMEKEFTPICLWCMTNFGRGTCIPKDVSYVGNVQLNFIIFNVSVHQDRIINYMNKKVVTLYWKETENSRVLFVHKLNDMLDMIFNYFSLVRIVRMFFLKTQTEMTRVQQKALLYGWCSNVCLPKNSMTCILCCIIMLL